MARAEQSRRDRRDPNECRCLCGSLVARRVPDGVELKCRRCKRTVVLPLEVAPTARVSERRPEGNQRIHLRPAAPSPAPGRLDPSPEPVR